VDRVGAALLRRADVLLGVEVRGDLEDLVGNARMERAGVVGRDDGDRRDPALAAGAEDADGDLATVRYYELAHERAVYDRSLKRHPALVPLSHDHHHALSQARRLRQAGEAGDVAYADVFLRFFRAETTRHFREEEELVFPLLLGHGEAPPEPLVRALVEHGRIRALAVTLSRAPDEETMRELAVMLTEHVRLEERVLFELVQTNVPEHVLRKLALGPRTLTSGEGPGPVWGTESEDLNATVIVWPPGGGVPDHVNEQRDVLFVVLEGDLALDIDGARHRLRAGDAIVIEKGHRRGVEAGPRGARYLTAHLRRGGLQISGLSR
jgi:mannose-6-phosphate isomerase-like protein (cupin superfamily)